MASATQEQRLPTGTYTLDPVHSTVGFAVKHMVVSTFRGSFGDYTATLDIDEAGRPTVNGAVRVDSVEVKDPNLEAHLQSPDFFDSERHPEITFSSTGTHIAETGELAVAGELSIKGHVGALDARGTIIHVAADLGGAERVGVDLEAVIDRTAFGLEWNAPLPKGGFALANDVKLHAELEFVKQA